MSDARATAELIEDGGEAAASDQFFRSRPFLNAEGATHTLRIEGEGIELCAPLIVREIEGVGERDAVSPYGYPGSSGCGSPLYPYASQRTAATEAHRTDPRISPISSSAPALCRGSLRLPHLGLCTQEGQPDSQGHSPIRRAASPSRRSNCS